MNRHRLRLIVPALCVAAILASPPSRAALKGALLVPEVIASPIHPLSVLTPTPRRRSVRLAQGTADLYRPAGPATAPGLVLVPGGDPEGKDDPRIVHLAQSIARAGRQVLVPQLGLRTQRLDLGDPERVREAVTYLAAHSSGRKVGIFAISYGGGMALVAIEQQPAIQRQITFVATLGTYYRLLDLLQGATTHTVAYHGTTVAWQPDPSALGIAEEQLASLLGGADGAALAAGWAEQDPAGLAPGPRAAYDLLKNRDPGRFPSLAAGLPPGVQKALADFSPALSITEVDVAVFALHARTDPASPPTESRLLVEALAPRVPTRLMVVGNLSHASPIRSIVRDTGDAVRISEFATDLLTAQEGWPRP